MDFDQYILNCVPSMDMEQDWTVDAAIASGVVSMVKLPDKVDLREEQWTVRDQGRTGACVGFATADGLLRWHFAKSGKISMKQMPAPRFIWMANKETDDMTYRPTTFLEVAGTRTKFALKVAKKYGCVLEEVLPIDGPLSYLTLQEFYFQAAQLRIASYTNLGTDQCRWKEWLANVGPILTRLNVDATWKQATDNNGRLEKYDSSASYGGHAVCLVGYTPDYFIVRNSWGEKWGDGGFGYAYYDYAAQAFTEAYGALV